MVEGGAVVFKVETAHLASLLAALQGLEAYELGQVRLQGQDYTALGGEGDFPMTIIVDAEGIITFACRGSITHDELVAAVEDALSQ